jgi:flagellar assembly protein FliH
MSSKILTGGESGGLPEFSWPALPGAVSGAAGYSGTQETVIHEAPAQTRARLFEMERQLPDIIEKARQGGYREAESAAGERRAREVELLQRKVAETVERMVSLRETMRRQMEEDLVHLAVAIARRILRRELSVDPAALAGVVRAAIEQTDAAQLHRLRVAPGDREAVERMLAGMRLPSAVEVVADPSLESGAAILETARGKVDASVETQLQEVERGLSDLVRRQR